MIFSARERKTFGSNVSTTIIILMIFFALSPAPFALSQIPQGFNYQALVRDGTGEILDDITIDVQIDIETSAHTLIWREMHNDIQTSQFGLMSLVVGTGLHTGGSAHYFSDIDWNAESMYLKTWIDIGKGLVEMGTTQIWAVPYSLVAKDVEGPIERLGIEGTTTNLEEALFEVKNNTGQTVFAVYNEGVRIYVDDGAKGVKGGFAIGGFGTDKGTSIPLLVVDPDSVRVYINQTGKTVKGGFAIGGYGVDKTVPQNFLFVSDDSVRVYIDNADTDLKGVKGGFAIGGYGATKGKPQKLLTVSDDSVRIYIDDAAKSVKGGFAIGGFDNSKGEGNNVNFFNVSTDANDTINPSEPRILWYPLKNAFLTGQVLIELSDSVGTNSTATGFESKAVGDWSQAMGYMAIARGDYSTAIGDSAIAQKDNSFALGDRAKSLSANSFSFGKGATAKGSGSYAFGSQGINDEAEPTRYTIANGVSSFAIGMGAQTNERLAIAIGTDCTASGVRSIALGSGSEATGFGSVALGTGAYAYGNYAVATNFYAFAHAPNSLALGAYSHSYGYFSVAANYGTTAQAYNSFVIGRFNIESGTTSSWVSTDPLFVIGNGSGPSSTSNAVTVLKNGNVAIGHDAPTQQLDLSGQIRIRGGGPAAGEILTSDANGTASWEPLASHTHSATEITSGTLSISRGGTGRSTLTANKVLVGNGTGAILYPTNLHWDNTNSYLGISDATPSYSLDINGSAHTTSSTYLATSSGGVGIGTTSVGLYKMSVLSSGSGSSAATSHLENTNASGIALIASTNSTDGTALLVQENTGYSLRCDGYDPSWFVAFIVKGRNVGINTSSPSTNLDVNGNGRFRSISSGAYQGPVNRTSDGTLTTATSDMRLKENISTIHGGLNSVLNLRGVTFTWKDDPGMGTRIGLIAQEVESVLPELVFTNEVDGYKGVNYSEMTAVLIEAVKEQQSLIENQQNQINRLEKMVEELMAGK